MVRLHFECNCFMKRATLYSRFRRERDLEIIMTWFRWGISLTLSLAVRWFVGSCHCLCPFYVIFVGGGSRIEKRVSRCWIYTKSLISERLWSEQGNVHCHSFRLSSMDTHMPSLSVSLQTGLQIWLLGWTRYPILSQFDTRTPLWLAWIQSKICLLVAAGWLSTTRYGTTKWDVNWDDTSWRFRYLVTKEGD